MARRPAARAAPAPPPRRATRGRGRFVRERVYLLGIGALFVLLGVMASGPYADYTVAQQRVDVLQDQRLALDEAVATLEQEAERLQDPAALEEQARSQLGLVRPGEIPYIVTNPPTQPPVPVNANPEHLAGAGEPDSVIDRVRLWVASWTS